MHKSYKAFRVLVVCAVAALAASSNAQSLSFNVTPLAAPAGASGPADVGGTGQSLEAHFGATGGMYFGIDGTQAVRWQNDGQALRLTSPAGSIATVGIGINATGQIAGSGDFDGGNTRKAVWWSSPGSPLTLADVPGHVTAVSEAYAINDSSVIVGAAAFTDLGLRAVKWTNGAASILGNPNLDSVVTSINASGQVVGVLGGDAVRFSPAGVATPLGTVTEITPNNPSPTWVNDAGAVSGFLDTNDGVRAVRWNAALQPTVLPGIPGHTTLSSKAMGIDNTGLTVGTVELDTAGNYKAVIWGRDGTPTLLSSVVSGWTMDSALGIDSANGVLRIIGEAHQNGNPDDTFGVILSGALPSYGIPGDADHNGTVNTADFITLSQHFNQTGSYWEIGDFNDDGFTNALDFGALATHFGQSGPAPLPDGIAVPEPVFGLVGAAAFLLASRRRNTR